MPGTPLTVWPFRNASVSATACRMPGQASEPFARFNFVANKCPARQPMASVGLVLLQFILLNTAVAFANVFTL